MNVFRAFLLFSFLLIVMGTSRANVAPSARKICQIDLGFIENLSVSRDGRYMAILSLPGEKGSDCYVFDRRTHKTILVPGSSRMEPLVFSRDGRYLWVWGLHLDEKLPGLRLKPGDFPFIAKYNLRTRRFMRSLSGAADDDSVPSASALSRDGRTLIYATQSGWVWGFDTRTGKARWKRRAQDKGDEPVSITLSNDGSKFLRTSDEDGEAQQTEIVSTRSGRVLANLRQMFASPSGMRSAFSHAQFAPRGAQIAVFQPGSQEWVFFDSHTKKAQWKMGGPSRTSEGDLKWQWSPDARFVGVSGPKGFEVRDARTGRVLQSFSQLKDADIAFSPTGSRVYALREDQTGFGAGTAVWQWRLFPTRQQSRSDEHWMRKLHHQEERFALSRRHINQSLIIAARKGEAKRLAYLLAHGANIEARDSRNTTSLGIVAFGIGTKGQADELLACARVLIARGANVNARDGEGNSPLALAAMQNEQMTKLILDKLGKNAARYQKELDSALLYATSGPRYEIVKLLLDSGANANARDSEGDTAIMEATNWKWAYGVMDQEDEHKSILMVKQLLAHGANINARNKAGHTALEEAYDPVIKDALKRLGAKP